MARLHRRWSLLLVALLLLLASLAAAATAEDPLSEENIRVEVRYATEEESRWLDRWAAKYWSARAGSGSREFSIRPATDEESAFLNRMAGGSSHDGQSAGGGFDGHLEFDEDHPFGRIVVDAIHSGGSSNTKMDDDLENEERSHSQSRMTSRISRSDSEESS